MMSQAKTRGGKVLAMGPQTTGWLMLSQQAHKVLAVGVARCRAVRS